MIKALLLSGVLFLLAILESLVLSSVTPPASLVRFFFSLSPISTPLNFGVYIIDGISEYALLSIRALLNDLVVVRLLSCLALVIRWCFSSCYCCIILTPFYFKGEE